MKSKNKRFQVYLLVILKLILDIFELQKKSKQKGLRCFKWQFLSSIVGGSNRLSNFSKRGNLKQKFKKP